MSLILERIRESGLKLNKAKCEFDKEDIMYLGYKISSTGTTKINQNESVLNFPIPKNCPNVKLFRELANYFGKNIEHLASKMTPLYNL